MRWTAPDVVLCEAITVLRDVLRVHPWVGTLHAQLALLLEIDRRSDDAYEEHAIALRCSGELDRAFCHERRGAFETRQGWLRNALTSFRTALEIDRAAGGEREPTYREASTFVEQQLAAQNIAVPPPGREKDRAWVRACELEKPAGYGDRNELGELLADDVIEVERLLRAGRWDDAVAALHALRGVDAAKLVDAIGYASRGVESARRAGRRDAAIAIQELVVEAYAIWASWSTSGAEGLSRTAEVDRERALLRSLRAG